MSNPLSSGAVGLSMVPGWPVNQPAKTTPSNSPSTIALPEASPQKQPPQKQPLWQRRITELPPELLAMIFDYLEFDDIRRVNATCLAFREVVKEYNYIQELSYFARLPQCFREQYQQTAPWQKKNLQLHPFATSAPLNNRGISFRDRIIKNLPQMPALLCLGTLGKMEQCPVYRPVKRYKVTLPPFESTYLDSDTTTHGVCFSPFSGHLLFYGSCLNGSRILARDDQGQWAEEHLNWSDNIGSRVITGATFSARTNRLLTCSQGCVNTLRPDHHCWNDVSMVTLSDQAVQFSTSGKYMVAYNRFGPVTVWRMDENNDWLKMEVCGLSPALVVSEVQFSPSERYLAVSWQGKMTMLTLDDRGVWSAQPLILSRKDRISYASFSQVADQLLVGIGGHWTSAGRVSIYSPEPSGKWLQTVIFPSFCLLDFSPAGKYVFSSYSSIGNEVLLWRRPEKLSDWSLNHLHLPHLDAASRARLDSVIVLKHTSRVDKAQFSPSDSHLLVSCKTGTVYIWGKNQADKWSIQTITRDCVPTAKPCFSLSGLQVLTYNSSMVGILGRSHQKDWPLKGVIRQDGILKAYFNPLSLSEHEVVVLSRATEGDITNITLQVWEIRDAGTPD